MSQIERLSRLQKFLAEGQCVGRRRLLDEFEISSSTLKRDLAVLRDRLNAPLVWDRQRAGYRLDLTQPSVGPQYELPGLWLTAEEIHALLTMQHLLANLDAGGLLGAHIAPLLKRLSALLGTGAHASSEVVRRIHVQTVGARKVDVPHFQAVGSALLRRRRLVIDYHGRGRNVRYEREVSPQRLIHYRDNWYLDAWCHLRDGLRSFAVDAIIAARVLDRASIDVPESELDDVLGAGYGIFAGREVQTARLRFSPERSRWVAAETWHVKQRGWFDAEGRWNLDLPYADPRELVMDILRHVPEVEVMWPEGLAGVVEERLREGLRVMGKDD